MGRQVHIMLAGWICTVPKTLTRRMGSVLFILLPLHPVQPLDDGREGQSIIADLTVALGLIAFREQPRGHRTRFLQRLDLPMEMRHQNKMVLASRQQQNVLFDQGRDICRYIG